MTMHDDIRGNDDRLREAVGALRSHTPPIPVDLRAGVLGEIAGRSAGGPVQAAWAKCRGRRWRWWISGALAAAAVFIAAVLLWPMSEKPPQAPAPLAVEPPVHEAVDWEAARLGLSQALRRFGDVGDRRLTPTVAAARTMASNLSGTYDGVLRARDATRQVNQAVRLLALVPSAPPNPVWVEKGMQLAGLQRSRRN